MLIFTLATKDEIEQAKKDGTYIEKEEENELESNGELP